MSRAHEPFISRRRFRTYSSELARLDGPCANGDLFRMLATLNPRQFRSDPDAAAMRGCVPPGTVMLISLFTGRGVHHSGALGRMARKRTESSCAAALEDGRFADIIVGPTCARHTVARPRRLKPPPAAASFHWTHGNLRGLPP